jgi:hypothetical protein
MRPCDHVGHHARRPIAIEHLQRQVLPGEFLLNALQSQPHIALHHAFGGAIALDRPAHEIVHAGIADVLDNRGIDVAQIDEIAGQALNYQALRYRRPRKGDRR